MVECVFVICGNCCGVVIFELYVVVLKFDCDWIFLFCVWSYFCRRVWIVSDVILMWNKERNLLCVRVLCEFWLVICDLWWECV